MLHTPTCMLARSRCNLYLVFRKYIFGFMKEFDEVLFSDQARDRTLGWQKYIEPVSFADRLIIFELCLNTDGLSASSFVHKRAGEKLKAGPIWDQNLALGFSEQHRFGTNFGISEQW